MLVHVRLPDSLVEKLRSSADRFAIPVNALVSQLLERDSWSQADIGRVAEMVRKKRQAHQADVRQRRIDRYIVKRREQALLAKQTGAGQASADGGCPAPGPVDAQDVDVT